MENQKSLKPWQVGYQPKDHINTNLVAHLRYSGQVGIDQWDVLSAYSQFTGASSLNDVMKWADTFKATAVVSLTISELS